jgi:hypothetical protein
VHDKAITNSESASHPKVIRNLHVVARMEYPYPYRVDPEVRDAGQPYLHLSSSDARSATATEYMYIAVCKVPARSLKGTF